MRFRGSLLLSLCFLAGCAKHHPVTPTFDLRHCPDGSVRHVASYQGRLIEICEDTATHGLFQMGPSCNPFQDQDCDEVGDKKSVRKSWWKFWVREKDDD